MLHHRKLGKIRPPGFGQTFQHLSPDFQRVISSPIKDAYRLFGIKPQIKTPDSILYKLTAVYDYPEYSSAHCGRKSRYEAWEGTVRLDKTFRQAFSWGRDGWLPRATRRNALPMFRGPAIPVLDRERRIIISEGEGGVFATIKAGWENVGTFFTCCLSEARTDAEPLAWRRNISIIPDPDISGYRRALALAEKLPKAIIIDPRDAPGDLADIIQAGWSASDFHSWIETSTLTLSELQGLACD